MNLRNKRKGSSSQDDENLFQYGSYDQSINVQQSGSDDVESNFIDQQNSQISYNGESELNRNVNPILTSGSVSKKKLKTNSGTGQVQNASNIHNACLKSAEEIIQHQQHVNNDCDIDCDGFREIYPDDLHTSLQEALFTEQTIVLRDAAGPKGYNVNSKNLFEFESVIKNHGDMQIECRIQNPTVYGFNIDKPRNSQHIYHTSIKEYGEYAQLLCEDKYDQIKNKLGNGVMFAVNIDMDDSQWNTENMRIRSSLPHYLLNKGKHDILSYHRQNVMGCTQPQMYLKVAGVWTGGHQENISVRAININHGDGESDWYCVDSDQVEKYRNFIKKKYSVDIHQSEGLWFGKYNDPEVAKAGIKIKKVTQRKNDIVILAPGVLHWVRCRGRSVQTAWNFAYRKLQDIVAMNERFMYNQKINFETIILNKALFMDLLNFEYHNLPQDACNRLFEIVTEYYDKEVQNESTILHNPLKSKNMVIFYDQLPAQLKHIQIYYCNENNCNKEIFCYFGVFRSQFSFFDQKDIHQSDFCGKYYCPSCIIDMKKIEDEIIIFRKFDLNSLRQLLLRVQNFLKKKGQDQPLYPIQDLTNIGHFCGQIQNINDFVFNKDVRRLEQVYIPDIYYKQGEEEMQKFQQDLQQNRLLDFVEKPILKFVTPIQIQKCDDIPIDNDSLVDSNNFQQNLFSQQDQFNNKEKQKIQPSSNKASPQINDIQETNKAKTKSKEQSKNKQKVINRSPQKQFENDDKMDIESNQQDDKISLQNNSLNKSDETAQKQQNQLVHQDQYMNKEGQENTNNYNFNQNGQGYEQFESSQIHLAQDHQISQQEDDEKLAIRFQFEEKQKISRTTRLQMNNSQKLTSIDTVSSKNVPTTVNRRGKKSIQSKEQPNNSNKKKQNQMTTSPNNISNNINQNLSEILSPTSSTTSGLVVQSTRQNTNGQQTEIGNNKKNKIEPEILPISPRINSDSTSISPNTNQKNDDLNYNQCGFKAIPAQQQQSMIPDSSIFSNQKIKLTRKVISEDDDEDDEETKKLKKMREIQKQQNLQVFENGFRQMTQQNEKDTQLSHEQKSNLKILRSPSSEIDETEKKYEKVTFQQLANTN